MKNVIIAFCVLAFACSKASTPTFKRFDASAVDGPSTPLGPQILKQVADRFDDGVTANQISQWVQASPPEKQGNGWVVSSSAASLTFDCVSGSQSEPANWIIATPLPGTPLFLGHLELLFGKFRELPPGEQTWVVFDAFRPNKVKVSALVHMAQDKAASKVIRIQFQVPR